MTDIEEMVCEGCKGAGMCDGADCDEYQIALLCDELFGAEFWERWDGFFPNKTGALLRGLRGLKMLKELAIAVSAGEIK